MEHLFELLKVHYQYVLIGGRTYLFDRCYTRLEMDL